MHPKRCLALLPWFAWLTMLLVVAPATPAAGGGDDEGDDDDIASNQAIVVLEPGYAIDAINADYATTTLRSYEPRNMHLLQLPGTMTEDEFETLIDEDDRVEEAELNHLADVPEGNTQDFYVVVPEVEYGDQYAWDFLGISTAHLSSTGTGVVVAVLDTGVDASHEGLAEMIVDGGYNFVDDNADVADAGLGEMVGHGTFMAGLIAYVAPDASILPVRVLDADGNSDAFLISAGIYHAIEQGAHVINLSLGLVSAEPNEIMLDAFEDAAEAGILLVAAAGNANAPAAIEPAAQGEVLAVASTDARDVKTVFSNYGEDVALCAPGSAVVSTLPENLYGSWNGTSLSCAITSGVAALVWSAHEQPGAEAVATALVNSTDDISAQNPGYPNQLGSGRLDAAAAVSLVTDLTLGDLDIDGDVDVADLVMLLGAWNQTDEPAFDLDGNGIVGVGDLIILISNWG